MSEKKAAVGVCQEISERGEWTTFHINVGSKYPVRVTSKKDEIIAMGRTAKTNAAVMEWHYTETESENINPNSGKPYINRYLEKVVPITEETAAAQQATAAKAEVDWGKKDERITRLACIKAAAEFCASKQDSTQMGVISAAEAFENWVNRSSNEPFIEHDPDDIPF